MIKNFKRFVEFFFPLFYLAIFRTSGPIREQLYKQFFNKLKIFDTGYKLIRVGPESDGGYVLPNILDQLLSINLFSLLKHRVSSLYTIYSLTKNIRLLHLLYFFERYHCTSCICAKRTQKAHG